MLNPYMTSRRSGNNSGWPVDMETNMHDLLKYSPSTYLERRRALYDVISMIGILQEYELFLGWFRRRSELLWNKHDELVKMKDLPHVEPKQPIDDCTRKELARYLAVPLDKNATAEKANIQETTVLYAGKLALEFSDTQNMEEAYDAKYAEAVQIREAQSTVFRRLGQWLK